MKFLMLVSLDPDRDKTDEDMTGTLDIDDWVAKYDASGVRLMGNQVRMAEDSTSVRRRRGELLVTDGPYAESREWIVGFDVLECADLDEAIKVASEHEMAVGGRLELRPLSRTDDDEIAETLAAAMAAERLRIVASLIRTTRDWDLAEDAVADAAERALLTWPRDGVPRNPAAWLTTTAQRRALDVIRRAATERAKLAEVAGRQLLEERGEEETVDHGAVTDDRLRLVFTCCHPALAMEARVALTLKVVAGLSTEQVARMFLVAEPTMSQRLLRAKKRIANAGIPYKVPEAADLPERLDGVLAVVYLVFTQGYAGAAAPELAEEAIRLGRLLTVLLPDEDEVTALLALMLAQHARRDARLVDGQLVTLEHQDRSRSDRDAVGEALGLTMPPGRVPGPYRLQAELALTHLRAADAADTDWRRIVRLYERLLDLQPSPVVALNRAVAVGMAESPVAGLLLLDDLAAHPALQELHLLPAARADLLVRAGRTAEALTELDRALALAPTEHERRQLATRRATLGRPPD